MTSRTLFKNMYKTESKRNIWLFGISLAVIFLFLPFRFMAEINYFQSDAGVTFSNACKHGVDRPANVLEQITYYNSVLYVFIGLLAVLSGLFLFSYLFSKQKQDFYFSLPVRRKNLFLCNYAIGIVHFVCAYVINIVITLIMAVANNCCTGVFLKAFFQCCFTNFLLFLCMYTVTILAVTLTGTFIFGVLGTAVLAFYFPVLTSVIALAYDGYFGDFMEKMIYLSPATPCIGAYSGVYHKIYNHYGMIPDEFVFIPFNWKYIALMIIIFVGLFALVNYTYVKRNAENAGKAITFPIFKDVVKGFLLVIFSIGAAYILPEMLTTDALSCRVIGFIIGIVFGLFILDAMLDLRWNTCFKKGKKQLIYVVICTVIFIGMQVYDDSIRYKGFDNIPRNSSEQEYVDAGYVVSDYERITANKDVLDKFIEDAQNGKEGVVTIVRMDDYSENDLTNIEYQDGVYKIYRSYNRYKNDNEYKELLVLSGEDRDSVPRTFYVLCENDKLEFEDLRKLYYPTDADEDYWMYENNLPEYDMFICG